jgi:sporulation protein YlmC with PRC-barrel domain
MTNSTSAKKMESTQHNLRIKVLMEKLKSKLKGFNILDKQGFLVGKIKDVHIDNFRQLNLVVSNSDYGSDRPFLIRSTQILQVDYPNKAVFVDISKTEIDTLPLYQPKPSTKLAQPKPGVTEPQNLPAKESTETEEDEGFYEYSAPLDVVEEEVIRLLEERLIIDTSKQKVGEVIVRKRIETRMVQVPVRREILIIEQVDPERKQIAEIDLGEATGGENEQPETQTKDNKPTVRGVFNSPRTASLLLDAISKQKNHGFEQVTLEIVVENEEQRQIFQQWCDRISGK